MLNGKINVYAEIKTSKVKSEVESFFSSLQSDRIKRATTIGSSDIVLYELNEEYERDLSRIQELVESEDNPQVMVLSGHMDTEILLKAMRVGVKDYYPLPLEMERLERALSGIRPRKTAPTGKEAHIIDIMGSKGGVGTTTLAVNLATALASRDHASSVLIMDMNTLFGEVTLFLDVQSRYDWGEIARNIDRVDATYLLNAIPRHSSGVYVLPSPGNLNHQPMDLDRILGNLFSLMRRMFSYIIIDSGQRLDNIAIQTMHLSDTVLITSILNLPCLSNTNKLLMNLGEIGFTGSESFHIVINRYLRNSSITLEEAEKSISKKIFWTIPNDFPASMASINEGKPLVLMNPKSQVSRSIQALADSFGETGEERENPKSRSAFFSYRTIASPFRRLLSK